MRETRTVSVALATYNGELYLAQQLDSILCQDYLPMEIVVCDDASTDGTRKLLERYREKNPELFKLNYNENNLGYVRNFQKALSLCSGDYIALCDQDDIWEPWKIRTLLEKIGENDAIHSDALLMDENENIIAPSYTRFSRKKIKNLSFIDICFNNSITGCTLMIRRRLLEHAYPFPLCMAHDNWLALLALNGNGMAYISLPLVRYRQHDNNVLGAERGPNKSSQTKSAVSSKDEMYQRKKVFFMELLRSGRDAFSPKNSKTLENLYNYYNSYFDSIVRPRAFFFHLCHFRAFCYRKSVLQAIKNVVSSLIGKRFFQVGISYRRLRRIISKE